MTRFRSLLLASCCLLALASCKEEQTAAPPPPEVAVVEAKPQTVPLERELVGRLSPYRSADVRARVAGVLIERAYAEGSDVKEGQVLFRIDPAPLLATLNQARAQLAQAEATYANARTLAERARQLAPQKFVSQNDLDNAESAERTAAAAVEAARAAVRTAEINLGYANVTAPISGRAGKQRVTEGALVGQGEATLLTTVDQLDPLYANFSISANELASLRSAANVELAGTGQATVQVVLPDGTPYGEPGVLDFSDAVVDPSTGSVAARAHPQPGPEPAAGQLRHPQGQPRSAARRLPGAPGGDPARRARRLRPGGRRRRQRRAQGRDPGRHPRRQLAGDRRPGRRRPGDRRRRAEGARGRPGQGGAVAAGCRQGPGAGRRRGRAGQVTAPEPTT